MGRDGSEGLLLHVWNQSTGGAVVEAVLELHEAGCCEAPPVAVRIIDAG